MLTTAEAREVPADPSQEPESDAEADSALAGLEKDSPRPDDVLRGPTGAASVDVCVIDWGLLT
jgi:hypothetical protein